MDEALLLKVKKALKDAGLSEELSKDIEITDESQIDAEIEKLKAKQTTATDPEQLLKVLKDAGLEDSFKKYLQSETDRRVTQAIKTHDEKIKKEAEEKAAKDKEAKDKEKSQEGMTEEQKTIANLTDQVGNLTKLVQSLSETTVKSKRETTIKEALQKAGLKEGFSKFIAVEKDEDIPEAVENLKKEVLTLQQEEIDKKLKDGGTPVKGESAGTIEEEKAKEYAKQRNEGAAGQPFQGKEVIEINKGKDNIANNKE
jgi:hypothetical protein